MNTLAKPNDARSFVSASDVKVPELRAPIIPHDYTKSSKSSAAFRTISEVADDLGVQQHVLRFWETKFSQVKPLKRGGGRRYYRPEDVQLLRSIHRLLYTEGYTIKGVQKLLRDVGKKQIIGGFAEDGFHNPPPPAQQQTVPAASAEGKAAPKSSVGLTAEQRQSLQAVLAELKELRGMIKAR